MKTITLAQGYVALVDDEDYERVNQFVWYPHFDRRKDGSVKNVYAVRNVHINGKRTARTMHTLIMEHTPVDHRDHDGLNNQRTNLRKASGTQNNQNARKRRDSTSGFKGVTWYKALNKWMAQIQNNGKKIHLGYFTDILDAARAYDAAALKYFGEFAVTNVMLGLLPKEIT